MRCVNWWMVSFFIFFKKKRKRERKVFFSIRFCFGSTLLYKRRKRKEFFSSWVLFTFHLRRWTLFFFLLIKIVWIPPQSNFMFTKKCIVGMELTPFQLIRTRVVFTIFYGEWTKLHRSFQVVSSDNLLLFWARVRLQACNQFMEGEKLFFFFFSFSFFFLKWTLSFHLWWRLLIFTSIPFFLFFIKHKHNSIS